MKIKLRALRNALQYPHKMTRPTCVILRCETASSDDCATITVENSIGASETAFTSEPDAGNDEVASWRGRVERAKLKTIAEQWHYGAAEPTAHDGTAELTTEAGVLRLVKQNHESRLEARLALEPAPPPHCVDLRYTDAESAATTATGSVGEILTRLEKCAPAGRIACIQSARGRPGELWIEMFDDRILIAQRTAGEAPAEAIELPTRVSRRIATMLDEPFRHIPNERLTIRAGAPREGPMITEMRVDAPRPGDPGGSAPRLTRGRVQWVARDAVAPELMRRAYDLMKNDELPRTAARYARCATSRNCPTRWNTTRWYSGRKPSPAAGPREAPAHTELTAQPPNCVSTACSRTGHSP